jgi:phosphotransacetylase
VRARKLAATRAAVVAPSDPDSLAAIKAAADLGSIVPVLIGVESALRQAAEQAAIDLRGLEIVPVANPRAAIAEAIRFAREGSVEGIVKGNVTTEELIVPVLSSAHGLRTDRRVSHVHLMDVPTYRKPLFITDTMINIAPGLREKRDICQNVVDLARWLGIPAPKVAVLAALETINPKMPATVEAATLCKMAERGQIVGAILDGPLTVDHALSQKAAEATGIRSPVAGQADVLLAPDIESANRIAKQLANLADALSAGIVLGARVPIALTSRGDDRRSWLASAALVQLVAHMYREAASVR